MCHYQNIYWTVANLELDFFHELEGVILCAGSCKVGLWARQVSHLLCAICDVTALFARSPSTQCYCRDGNTLYANTILLHSFVQSQEVIAQLLQSSKPWGSVCQSKGSKWHVKMWVLHLLVRFFTAWWLASRLPHGDCRSLTGDEWGYISTSHLVGFGGHTDLLDVTMKYTHLFCMFVWKQQARGHWANNFCSAAQRWNYSPQERN